jgi:hypothetical protein
VALLQIRPVSEIDAAYWISLPFVFLLALGVNIPAMDFLRARVNEVIQETLAFLGGLTGSPWKVQGT